jgi:hypothetical protein
MSRQYKFVGEVLYAHGDKLGGEVTAKGLHRPYPAQYPALGGRTGRDARSGHGALGDL